jgi:hypothetical protein
MTVYDCIWLYSYMTVYDCIWLYMYMIVHGCIWLFTYMTIYVYDCIWLYTYMTVYDCIRIWLYMTVYDCIHRMSSSVSGPSNCLCQYPTSKTSSVMNLYLDFSSFHISWFRKEYSTLCWSEPKAHICTLNSDFQLDSRVELTNRAFV